MSSEKDPADPKAAGAPSSKEGGSMPPNPRSLPPPTAAIDDEWASESSGDAPAPALPQVPAPPKMPEMALAAAAPEPVAAEPDRKSVV
jgi:hypothetical protein